MQPPRRGQVQPSRGTPDLEDHGGKRGERGRLFGDPQRVFNTPRSCHQQQSRCDAEAMQDARRIRRTRLGKRLARSHPQKRQGLVRLLQRKRGKR